MHRSPVGRDSEFMQVQHMELFAPRCAAGDAPTATAAGEAATYCAQSRTEVATTGWVGAVEAKVGPRGRIGRSGAAVCRGPCGSARTRHAFWTVLCCCCYCCALTRFCVLSVCLVLSLRVSNPWETERLFTSVPRTVRAPLTLPRGSVVPYQNAECTNTGADLQGLEHPRGWQVG